MTHEEFLKKVEALLNVEGACAACTKARERAKVSNVRPVCIGHQKTRRKLALSHEEN